MDVTDAYNEPEVVVAVEATLMNWNTPPCTTVGGSEAVVLDAVFLYASKVLGADLFIL